MRRASPDALARPVATVFELLPRQQQLALAVRTKGPAALAGTFARWCGQFYDRTPFDAVARV